MQVTEQSATAWAILAATPSSYRAVFTSFQALLGFSITMPIHANQII